MSLAEAELPAVTKEPGNLVLKDQTAILQQKGIRQTICDRWDNATFQLDEIRQAISDWMARVSKSRCDGYSEDYRW